MRTIHNLQVFSLQTTHEFCHSLSYPTSHAYRSRQVGTSLYSQRVRDALPKQDLWHSRQCPSQSCPNIRGCQILRLHGRAHRSHIDQRTIFCQFHRTIKVEVVSYHTLKETSSSYEQHFCNTDSSSSVSILSSKISLKYPDPLSQPRNQF